MAKVPETWRQNLIKSGALDEDNIKELEDLFNKLDTNGDNTVDERELSQLFKILGEHVPPYKCREYMAEMDKNKNGRIEMEEFLMLFAKHQVQSGKDMTRRLADQLAQNLELVKRTGHQEGVVHSYSEPERRAFAEWINQTFKNDDGIVKKYLPVNPDTEELFQRVMDGVLLIKVINVSSPDTIDERVMNKCPKNEWQMRENHELALNSASSIGCSIVNMGAADMLAGTPHLVLGVLWQIIKIGLVSSINLLDHPGLACLLNEESGETMRDLQSLSPEELLIRWVNYHLKNAGIHKRINNFTEDIKDSEAYIWLLHQIAPPECEQLLQSQQHVINGNSSRVHSHSPMEVIDEQDLKQRAKMTLDTADVLGCRAFVNPQDIVEGNYKLNLAFVANLFNTYPALDTVKKQLDASELIVEETREEKTFRNWINSLGLKAHGVNVPFVNHLFPDMANGLVILAIEDQVAPGVVEWKKIAKPPFKMEIYQRQNCKYAVDYAKGPRLKLKIVGIGGDNLFDQSEEDQTLKLGLIWQLMRAYTANILQTLAHNSSGGDTNGMQKDVEKLILEYVNNKLLEAGKSSSISSFKDSSIATSVAIIDLIDAIKPKVVDYTLVNLDAADHPSRLSNAKLAINWGRKIGARIYALPDDIVEVKPKMVLTVFACLMARGLQNLS